MTETIAQAVHAARVARGWSIVRVAERAGVDWTVVSRIERAQGVRSDLLALVLEALGLTLAVTPQAAG